MSVLPQLLSPTSTVTHPYLWVVGQSMNGQAIADMPPGTVIGDRFEVIAPHIWKDLQPDSLLERDIEIPAHISRYLKLYEHRLHIPDVYGIWPSNTFDDASNEAILLLSNVPIAPSGELLPTIGMAWENATPVRQLYWLWQLGELCQVLKTEHAASSVLVADNIHVDGWRIRLRELIFDFLPESDELHHDGDHEGDSSQQENQVEQVAPFSKLGTLWMSWIPMAHSSIQEGMQAIAEALQHPQASWSNVYSELNQLLIAQAAHLPLKIDIAGATSPGHKRSHNEDACYPITLSLNGETIDHSDGLKPRVAIVCDGIAGHAGGEVASRLTVRALKLQLRALFADLAAEETPLPPDAVMRQIEAAIRVVNNLVAYQNDESTREARQRMGTTLVMALEIPQKVETSNGRANTHEIYIAQVGDSRAYWLTPSSCHCLTVDDDVQTREVLVGRSLPRESARRTDASALTQALGTRNGEYLQIKLQRFIIEEDGVMLLCTDGLSDTGMIECHSQSMAKNVLRGKLMLNKAATIWLKLAEQHNGRDNASVVLMRCRVSKASIRLFDPSIQVASSELRPLSAKDFNTISTISRAHLNRVASRLGESSQTTQPLNSEEDSSPDQEKNPEIKPSTQAKLGDGNIPGSVEKDTDNGAQDVLNKEKLASGAQSSEFGNVSLNEFEQLTQDFFEEEVDNSVRSEDVLGTESSHVIDHDSEEEDNQLDWNVFFVAVGLSIVMFILGAVGVFAWRKYAPTNFNDKLEQAVNVLSRYIFPAENQTNSPSELNEQDKE